MNYRTIAVIRSEESPRSMRRLTVRRDGSQLSLSLATGDGIPLSLAYLHPHMGRDQPPAFARGTDAEAVEAVRAWVARGGNQNITVEMAPDATGQAKPETADDLLARAHELIRDARGTINSLPTPKGKEVEAAVLTGSLASALRAVQQSREFLAAMEG